MAKLRSSLSWIRTLKARNNLHRVMSRCILSRIFLVIKALKFFIQVNSFCNRQSKFKHSNLNRLMMIISLKIYRKRIIKCPHNAYRNRISPCTQHSASILFQKTWVAQPLVQTRQLTRHFEVLLLPVLNSMVSRTWLIKDDSNKVRIILKSQHTLKFKIGLQSMTRKLWKSNKCTALALVTNGQTQMRTICITTQCLCIWEKAIRECLKVLIVSNRLHLTREEFKVLGRSNTRNFQQKRNVDHI